MGAAVALAVHGLECESALYRSMPLDDSVKSGVLLRGATLALWTEGVSQGEQGASAAAVLCLIDSQSEVADSVQTAFLHDPSSVRSCIVACACCRVGQVSHVTAQFEAAMLGRRLLLDWLTQTSLLV